MKNPYTQEPLNAKEACIFSPKPISEDRRLSWGEAEIRLIFRTRQPHRFWSQVSWSRTWSSLLVDGDESKNALKVKQIWMSILVQYIFCYFTTWVHFLVYLLLLKSSIGWLIWPKTNTTNLIFRLLMMLYM